MENMTQALTHSSITSTYLSFYQYASMCSSLVLTCQTPLASTQRTQELALMLIQGAGSCQEPHDYLSLRGGNGRFRAGKGQTL